MTDPLILDFVGIVLTAMFYGIYCAIFALYLGIQLKRENGWKGVLFYALTVNFILCTAYIVSNVVQFRIYLNWEQLIGSSSLLLAARWLSFAVNILSVAIDLISQLILFHRCWIMWRKPLVLIVPGLFSLAFLVTSLTTLGSLITYPGYVDGAPNGSYSLDWFSSAVVAFFTLSMVANSLLTGLIVYKILSVYRSIDKTIYGNGPRHLYPLISILVESGMITFVAQLLQSILYKVNFVVYGVISGPVVMLYGISTTLVLVRVGLGVSYDHRPSRPANLSHSIHLPQFSSTHNQTTNDVAAGDPNNSHSISEMKLMRNV